MSMTPTEERAEHPRREDRDESKEKQPAERRPTASPAEAAPITGGDDSASGAAHDGGKGLGLVQLIGSAFAAALGVQSSRNRERDFKQGRAGTFILVGLVFTALFIGAVYGVVSLVLSSR